MSMQRMILTVFPFIWTIGLLPFANHVKPFVFGLPFLAFWLSFSIYVTFVCILLLYRLDSRARRAEGGNLDD
ncbi:DUF3311 domain-containing protein [Siculibacillus lacustris]|uniref:DUF3311 domain-containing protein n=1 Tax=Siculibacillus lacustris TaxID=1549641 RepID=A0A4V2KSP9_9HYPH|nr:DUF3311 domain-containing protein [Siculibacillus lacustris]TBW33799.1 DUF3311 domain-containing protein [Siculibacillus lacustris]